MFCSGMVLRKLGLIYFVSVMGIGLSVRASATETTATQPSPLDRAFHAMYDLDFDRADREIATVANANPMNPVAPAAEAASVLFSIFARHNILQAQFFVSDDHYKERRKVEPDPGSLQRLERSLDRAEQLANAALARDPRNVDALFALTLVYGLRADYAALLERRDMAALRYSKQANQFAARLLAINSRYYDAYLATGLQKYLVSLKSAPVRLLLRLGGIQGDREEAIQELRLVAERGRYLAPFAQILLSVSRLRDGDREGALQLLSSLRNRYPHNPLFAQEVARLESD